MSVPTKEESILTQHTYTCIYGRDGQLYTVSKVNAGMRESVRPSRPSMQVSLMCVVLALSRRTDRYSHTIVNLKPLLTVRRGDS